MKKLVFNDSRQIEVQSVAEAGEGILHVRMILVTAESLKALFGDIFATQKMTYFVNQAQAAVYENYTEFKYIKEETGGIFEVEMRQTVADMDTRITALETASDTQASDIEQLKKDVGDGGAGMDKELLAATAVVARANAQALTDYESLKAKVLFPAWSPDSVQYAVGYKVLHEDILYKCISAHTSQADRAPGVDPSLWTAVETGEHAGTLEDPVPVPDTVTTAGMEYECGKYYSEGGTVYLMDRQGMDEGDKVTLYFPPSELIGQYFSAAE